MSVERVEKLEDLFNKIGVVLNYMKQNQPEKPLTDQVKEILRSRCNQLLQLAGPAHPQNYVENQNQNQNIYKSYNNNDDNNDDEDEYTLSNENVRILERFPTRESYNSYVQGPNDPLQPFLNNVNKNRLWLPGSPSKTKKRPKSNIRAFMASKPPSNPSRPTKKGSFWNRSTIRRRRF